MHRQAVFVNLAFFQGHDLAANPADMFATWRGHHWLTRLQFGPNQLVRKRYALPPYSTFEQEPGKTETRTCGDENNEPSQSPLLSVLTVAGTECRCQNISEITVSHLSRRLEIGKRSRALFFLTAIPRE